MKSLCQSSLLLALLWSALSANAAPQGFYRQPTIQGDTLVFLSQGDLWRASAQGGSAMRLTSHAGQESNPVLLPDGRTLAYVGQRDGAGDIYTQPVDGGEPTRRTWLASGQLRLWGTDAQGALLLTALADDGRPVTQAYRLVGERLEALPLADASDVAASLDGKQWIFTRNGLRGDNAKGYRGGALASLWRMDASGTAEARPLLDANFPRANNKRPMPYRDAQGRERIAFLSDRDGIFNVWSVAADGSDTQQHTRWREFDVRWASISGGQIALARGADLHRVDLNAPVANSSANTPVNPTALAVSLLGDQSPAAGTRWIKRPQDFLTEIGLSADGERAVIGVRGRLATQGTQGLRRAVLQQADGSRCHQANFSPDGRLVYALCDFSGEVEVWQLDALGGAARKQITNGSLVLRNSLKVSPDGRYLAHSNLGGALFLTDLKAEGGPRTQVIDQAVRSGISSMAWHPDSQALAYEKGTTDSGARNQIWLYALADKKARSLTSPRFDNGDPAFSPDGQWLYFGSRRHFATQPGSSVWADRNMGPAFEPGIKLYALALQAGLTHPMEAKNELTPRDKPKADAPKDDKSDKSGKDAADSKDAKESKDSKDSKDLKDTKDTKDAKDTKPARPALPKIALDGLADRLYELPLPAGQYRDLAVDAKRLWWMEVANPENGGTLRSVAIERDASPETTSEKVKRFELSAGGKHLLLQREMTKGGTPELLIVEAAHKLPTELAKSTVRWSDWNVDVSPRQEWQQLFDDAWRLSRDHFYDAKLQGVDWKASRSRHAALLPRVGDRAELAELMAQMTSDLNLLHSQIAQGDLPAVSEEAPALAGLGAQLEPHAKGARIARIYRGDPELVSERGPLQAPRVDVREGDVITTINGRTVVWPQAATLLQGEAGKQVRLEIVRGASTPRAVIVTAVDARREATLRYQDWRTSRMEAVDKASKGRIGYLHLRAMGPADIADFAKDFYAQLDKEALIIDVRFNSGGNIDSWVLEKLLRRAWAWWQPRHPAPEHGAASYPNMQGSFNGPLAALINENTYSDGETFAEGFKRLKLGPVIGKTTSGAGVWLTDRNRLADNGMARAAENAQMDANGQLLVEGKGVTPDVEVDNPPRATAAGGDAQLDAAIATLLKTLPATPPQRRTPQVASYPKY